jgi:hypothetical protein
MNKIFKVIWNNAKHCYVVASELAKSHSKSNSNRTIRRAVAALGIVVAVYAATGSAIAENSGGSLDQNTGDYRGYSNFTVTIDSDVTGNVYGRRSVSGKDAEKASVTITNGIVSKNVYGGYVELVDADVSSNSVTINGGTIDGSVIGGNVILGSGEAASNSVTINGVNVAYDVSGGFSDSGDAINNSVTIKDGSVGINVYGGYSHSNTVNNSVSIDNGTVNKSVYGGYGLLDTKITASNSVTISGDSTITGSVYGGYVQDGYGDAIDNSVNFNNGIIKRDEFEYDSGHLYGGRTYAGKAASNSINISGGTVEKSVFGGWSSIGNVTSNSVTISGESTKISNYVYGVFSS